MLKDRKNQIVLAIIIVLLLVGAILLVAKSSDDERTSNLTEIKTLEGTDYDALYNEIVAEFSVNVDKLSSFVFVGDDKVFFQDSEQITQVYNSGNGWKLAYKGIAAPSCEEVSEIPEGYKVACGEAVEGGLEDPGDWAPPEGGYFDYLNPIPDSVDQAETTETTE